MGEVVRVLVVLAGAEDRVVYPRHVLDCSENRWTIERSREFDGARVVDPDRPARGAGRVEGDRGRQGALTLRRGRLRSRGSADRRRWDDRRRGRKRWRG